MSRSWQHIGRSAKSEVVDGNQTVRSVIEMSYFYQRVAKFNVKIRPGEDAGKILFLECSSLCRVARRSLARTTFFHPYCGSRQKAKSAPSSHLDDGFRLPPALHSNFFQLPSVRFQAGKSQADGDSLRRGRLVVLPLGATASEGVGTHGRDLLRLLLRTTVSGLVQR